MNYLLDASGIIFRSYFAFSKKYQYEPQNLSALFGFCSSIIKILSMNDFAFPTPLIALD